MVMFMRFLRPTGVFALLLCVPLSAMAADPVLKAQPRIIIAGTRGGFTELEVDKMNRRLLLAHAGNGTLDVMELGSETVIKTIPCEGISRVTLDTNTQRYFASGQKRLHIVDAKKLDIVGHVDLPGTAGALTLGPTGVNRVFVASEGGKELWVIDPSSKQIASTVDLSEGIRALCAEDETSRLFAATQSDDAVQVISAADNNSTLGGTWPVAPAKKPVAMTLDKAGERRLFVAGTNGKLVVLRASDGRLLGSANIPSGAGQISLDADRSRLYCAASSGRLAVLDTSGNGLRAVGEVPTPRGAKSVAVDPQTHAVWIAFTEGGKSFVQKFTP